MATKHQKFKINVSEKYTKEEKISIAKDVIDFVVDRTLKGVDKDNKKFTPGYSEGYAGTPEAQAAGKRKGGTPTLRLSGDMLSALGELIKVNPRSIEIGYRAGSQENAKADGNVRGTYGKKTPSKKLARDFMGISEKDLDKIKNRYPLDDREKREDAVSVGKAIVAAARKTTKET